MAKSKADECDFYCVVSKRDGEEFIETIRTERSTAEDDVRLFADICRRHTWIVGVTK